jgi:glutamate synthase (NADPH/NADH) small chain
MGASTYEQEFAQTTGVKIRHWAKPKKLLIDGRVAGMEFEKTKLDDNGKLSGTGETFSLNADVVFKAIGQTLSEKTLGVLTGTLERNKGKIVADDELKTSLPAVWAGGDCVYGGDDLTVSAVQDGKIAAIAIDRYLREESNNG